MNKSILAILLLSSAASAFAFDASDDLANRTPFKGTLTRAEVQAGIAQAKAEGTLRQSEIGSNEQKASGSSRSRLEVRSEAIQAAQSHAGHSLY